MTDEADCLVRVWRHGEMVAQFRAKHDPDEKLLEFSGEKPDVQAEDWLQIIPDPS